MVKSRQIVVGLGNKGPLYLNNRHNAGYIAVDALSQKYGDGLSIWKENISCFVLEVEIANEPVILLKPNSYINVSGVALHKFMSYFRFDLSSLTVIHDDLDLDTGAIKIKKGGGSGGHNGIKSIDNIMGNEYNRIRIGISHPRKAKEGENRVPVEEYVLQNFQKSEQELIAQAIVKISDNIATWLFKPR